MNSTNHDLHATRRTLDKAQQAHQEQMLSSSVRAPRHEDGRANDTAEWNAAYYSSGSLKSFKDRFNAFFRSDRDRAHYAIVTFNAVVKAWEAYEVARVAEKARLAAKRDATKANAAQRKALNLADSVSLKGVDVGQYQVILAGLDPVRKWALKHYRTSLLEQAEEQIGLLNAANGDAKQVKEWTRSGRFNRHTVTEHPENFHRYFVRGFGHLWTARPAAEVADWIEGEAERKALAYVQGYAAKLAMKTGEYIADKGLTAAGGVCTVTGCSVTSNNLWSDSVATISLGNGMIRFHTQMIWNRSCLGTEFNQWPTRLMLWSNNHDFQPN